MTPEELCDLVAEELMDLSDDLVNLSEERIKGLTSNIAYQGKEIIMGYRAGVTFSREVVLQTMNRILKIKDMTKDEIRKERHKSRN